MTDTILFLTRDGDVFRKELRDDLPTWGQLNMSMASHADQIIRVTQTGRGKTIKNRFSDKPQYFSRKQIMMLMLQAQTL